MEFASRRDAFSKEIALVLLLVFAIPIAQSCTSVSSVLAPRCASYISWNVSDSLNQSVADSNATNGIDDPPEPFCPYYADPRFQCRKYFPQCDFDATSGLEIIRNVCRSSCFAGQTANDNECAKFSDEYFQSECNGTAFSDASNCIKLDLDGSEDFAIWKIVLISVLVGIGCIVLGSWAFSKWREWRYDYNKDPHADEVVEKDTAAAQLASQNPDQYHDIGLAPPPNQNRPVVTMAMREAAFKGQPIPPPS